jgi:hypothetical protein
MSRIVIVILIYHRHKPTNRINVKENSSSLRHLLGGPEDNQTCQDIRCPGQDSNRASSEQSAQYIMHFPKI